MKKFSSVFLVVLFSLLSINPANGQDIKYRLFKDLTGLLKKAKTVNAQLLSPQNFEEGYDYYTDALESLNDNDPLEDVKASISKSAFFLNKAVAYARKAKKFFAFTLKARSDAEKVFADSLAPKLWKKAESRFNDACEDFEDNENQDAEDEAFEAEKIYRSAELKAIKRIYLDKARAAIKKAKDEGAKKLAPKTLKKAEQNLYNAEKELENKRYNNDYAKELEAKAFSEAQHAAFLSKMFKEMDDEDQTLEDLSLYWEKPLCKIAEYFNIEPYFNNGPDSLVDEIMSKLQILKAQMKEEGLLENKVAALKTEIAKTKIKLSELQKRLAKILHFVRKLREVKNLFKSNEAEVFTRNGNIVIRLRKLKFAPGSAVIAPKYFGLLSKVGRAIEKFPDASITVAGHTDASGKAGKNLIISQKRAEAVYKYLLANSGVAANAIHAVGYGESRPVATNKTDAGKSKNRRIEIIIKPAENIFDIN